MQSVAIVGTGLIGASFGLALRHAGFRGSIVGVSSPAALDGAIAAGAIDHGAPLADAVAHADLVFLSQTIGRILDTLRKLDPLVQPGALVTDAGSTKCEIVDTALKTLTRARFLGGHPMAGKERRGAEAAEANLFQKCTWVVTPMDSNDLATPKAAAFLSWIRRIGAHPVVMKADEHDRVVAYTSHVPQLASTALAATVAERVDAAELAVAGSGLRDMTRLALGSYELWRDILATNAGHVDQALGFYIQKLEHLRENLRTLQMREEFQRAERLAADLRRAK
jgi:prephenate dehydrogenase